MANVHVLGIIMVLIHIFTSVGGYEVVFSPDLTTDFAKGSIDVPGLIRQDWLQLPLLGFCGLASKFSTAHHFDSSATSVRGTFYTTFEYLTQDCTAEYKRDNNTCALLTAAFAVCLGFPLDRRTCNHPWGYCSNFNFRLSYLWVPNASNTTLGTVIPKSLDSHWGAESDPGTRLAASNPATSFATEAGSSDPATRLATPQEASLYPATRFAASDPATSQFSTEAAVSDPATLFAASDPATRFAASNPATRQFVTRTAASDSATPTLATQSASDPLTRLASQADASDPAIRHATSNWPASSDPATRLAMLHQDVESLRKLKPFQTQATGGRLDTGCDWRYSNLVPVAWDGIQNVLTVGQNLQSPDSTYALVMQQDCNLVLYKRGADGKYEFNAKWASYSQYNDPFYHNCSAVLQPNGNLVVVDAFGAPRWATNGTSASLYTSALAVLKSGIAAVYEMNSGTVLWSSG